MRIDPPGLWSTEAHNYFIDMYFYGIPKADKDKIKQGSQFADGLMYQFGNSAHMHAMGNGANTNAEQCIKGDTAQLIT